MTTLFRFFKIVHTFACYRLDLLLDSDQTPKHIKLLLLPFVLYPKPTKNRGYRIRKALEELGPIFVKFGQLLSTRPDLIADDIIQELNHLQDNVTPFAASEFRKIVEASLGDSVENIFQSFDEQPLGSASVAQVHAATLQSGESVIVKVIRPHIEKTITKDIKLLLVFARIIEKISADGRRLKPVEVVEDYRHTIIDELNLAMEAANASQLRRNFTGSEMLYIPKVYWEYSRTDVMVMERIYGIPVTNLSQLEAQDTNLKVLAERGVEIFFTQVFEHNFFHADMHPGNVFVSYQSPDQPSYIAVDMAIMGSLTREDQYYLARNLLAMFRRDYRQVAELHVLSGWVPKGTSIGGFEAAIRAVCEPIFEKPLKEISFGEALINIFKIARRYNMPVQPQLVLLQKTLLNIEGLGRQLYPELNLWDTAHPYLERWIKQRFHPKTLWNEFRYYAPEWMEKMPQMPQLLFDTLQESKNIAESMPRLIDASQNISTTHSRKRWVRAIIAAAAVGAACCLSWDTLENLPPESIILLFVAALALFS